MNFRFDRIFDFKVRKWREDVGIEPTAAFTQKPPIRVEALYYFFINSDFIVVC